MSQNFSLSISNPAAMGQDTQNVAYINAPGGNTLKLTLISSSSSIITIDSSDKDKFILKIPVEMLSSTDVRTDEAWTITLDSNDGDYYCFRLIPAGGQAVFKMEAPLLISVLGVQVNPALTTGKVENITVEYTQDGEEVLSANTYLIVCSLSPQTGVKHPLLIGADGLLTLSVLMNGQEGNPLIVSPAPTIPGNGLENAIQVNLVYQGPGATDDKYPANPPTSWDDNTRPTLKIYFPYTGQAQFVPDALCLTDTLQTGDPGFNKLTAADQIVYSLMPPSGAPDHTNTAWKIEMASDSTSTVWTLTPLSDNTTCLFTKDEVPGDPGPILNVFFSQVVSNLPILEEYPQTLLYLDWKNFPGYTDGMLVYSIRKEQLSIVDFSGTINLDQSSTKILFDWQTVNADHCLVTGDTAWQDTNPVSPFVETITPLLPMLPAYTLTAVGKGGVSASSTVGIGWNINATGAKITSSLIPQMPFVRPAEDQIVILNYGQALILNATTLGVMQALPGNDYTSVQLTQNGAALFLADTVAVYKYDMSSLQLLGQLTVDPGGGFRTLLGSNADGSVIAALTITANAKNIFSAISAGTMTPLPNSPVLTSATSLAIQPQTGRYYLSSADHIDVLDPVSLQPVAGSPIPIATADVITFSAQGDVYILSGQNPASTLSKVDGKTLQIVKSVTVDHAWTEVINFFGGSLNFRPGNILMLSPDGSQLFLAGSDGQNWDISAVFSVFDPTTLAQTPWQIGAPPDFLITGMALAPLSYRIFVTGVSAENHLGTIFSIDASFSVTA